MAVRCSQCGEQLLGAVNRCWKCGQTFAQRPEIDGRPPVRAEASPAGQQPLDAIVVEQSSEVTAPTAAPLAVPRFKASGRLTTSELIDARRAGLMATGGAVASLALGIFAAVLAVLWPPAVIIAVLGMAMGIWGLHSPRRNLALVGMLLCCLAIGLGTYGLARNVYVYVQSLRPVPTDDVAIPTPDDE